MLYIYSYNLLTNVNLISYKLKDQTRIADLDLLDSMTLVKPLTVTPHKTIKGKLVHQ